jgi:hypothetical protein
LLVLELQEPEDTTAGDNFPLQTEVAIDRWGEQDDDDDSIQGKAVWVPTYHTNSYINTTKMSQLTKTTNSVVLDHS